MKDNNKGSKSLNLDDLENISGGYLFNNKGLVNVDTKHNWEILDDKGEVVGRFSDYKEAVRIAGEMGQDLTVIDWDQVCDLRKKK